MSPCSCSGGSWTTCSPLGGSANPKPGNDMSEQVAEANKASTARHLGEQGRQGNIKQNTTHQGYQQDR